MCILCNNHQQKRNKSDTVRRQTDKSTIERKKNTATGLIDKTESEGFFFYLVLLIVDLASWYYIGPLFVCIIVYSGINSIKSINSINTRYLLKVVTACGLDGRGVEWSNKVKINL